VKTQFTGRVGLVFTHLSILNLFGTDPPDPFPPLTCPASDRQPFSLDLSGATISNTLSLYSLDLHTLLGGGLHASGFATLSCIAVDTRADFGQASFDTFTVSNVRWQQDAEHPRLEGIAYKEIHVIDASTADGADEPMRLLNDAQYSARAYHDLETLYMQQGLTEQANRVFIAQKRRERAMLYAGSATLDQQVTFPLRWLKSWLFDIFIRYGRYPGWAILWGLMIILFAWRFVWQRGNVLPRKPSDKDPTIPEGNTVRYNGFLYSLETFIPVLNLHMGDNWVPNRRPRYVYMIYVAETILGWLIVPIILAAIAGLLK
jgi:hypothetical protein